jgi:hypothetical protein
LSSASIAQIQGSLANLGHSVSYQTIGLRRKYEAPWFKLYDGEKPVVVGHHDYLRTGEPLIYEDVVYGIDTGCCLGGRLTGLLLPDFRIVSVPSRADYWSELQCQYADIHSGRYQSLDASNVCQSPKR